MPETLLLIDGHSLAFRAYHALPESLTDPQGQPANAVYGFLTVLFRLIEKEQPAYVAVAFDVGIPFRVELYDQYKAGRLEIDPAVERQVERLRAVLAAMQVPVVEAPEYEADDVLKTMAEQAEAQGVQTLVLSGDRDLFQIVTTQTTVLYPIRGSTEVDVYDPARVEERFGVPPRRLPDYKALVGDSSDNIPGVRGIGPKSASQLLQTYDSLDAIFADLDGIKSTRIRNALSAGGAREQATLARQLVTLVTVPEVRLDLAGCRLQYDLDQARAALEELGFKQLQNRLPEPRG